MKKYTCTLPVMIVLLYSISAAHNTQAAAEITPLQESEHEIMSRRETQLMYRELQATCRELNLSLSEVKQIITNHTAYGAQQNSPLYGPLSNFQAQAPSTAPSMPNITINMSQSPQLNATQAANQETTAHADVDVSTENTATNTTDVKTDVTTIQTNEQHQTIINTIYEKTEAAGSYLGLTKKKILFGAITTGYIGLFARLVSDNYFLKRSDLWSTWKQDIALEQLCILPRNNVLNQLQQDIQERYINPKNPINFVKPMTQFVNDTDYEMDRIQKYITITTWLSRFYCSSLFPINQEMLSLAQERIARLAFVRSLFNTWAAEYKIEMANRPPTKSIKITKKHELKQI